MKKIIFWIMESLLITVILGAVNVLTDAWLGIMFPAIPLGGGEMRRWIGFGVIREKSYPLTTMDDPNSVISKLYPSWMSFLAGFILIFLLVGIFRHVQKPAFLYRWFHQMGEKWNTQSDYQRRLVGYLICFFFAMLFLGVWSSLGKSFPYLNLRELPEAGEDGYSDVAGYGVLLNGGANVVVYFFYGVYKIILWVCGLIGLVFGIISGALSPHKSIVASRVFLGLSLVTVLLELFVMGDLIFSAKMLTTVAAGGMMVVFLWFILFFLWGVYTLLRRESPKERAKVQ